MAGKKKWIADATKGKGKLHEHLGVPKDEKIPEEKLRSATHSKNPTIRKEANLAMTLKGLHHGKKKSSTRSQKDVRGALYGTKE